MVRSRKAHFMQHIRTLVKLLFLPGPFISISISIWRSFCHCSAGPCPATGKTWHWLKIQINKHYNCGNKQICIVIIAYVCLSDRQTADPCWLSCCPAVCLWHVACQCWLSAFPPAAFKLKPQIRSTEVWNAGKAQNTYNRYK